MGSNEDLLAPMFAPSFLFLEAIIFAKATDFEVLSAALLRGVTSVLVWRVWGFWGAPIWSIISFKDLLMFVCVSISTKFEPICLSVLIRSPLCLICLRLFLSTSFLLCRDFETSLQILLV